jgi:hypothetical protein
LFNCGDDVRLFVITFAAAANVVTVMAVACGYPRLLTAPTPRRRAFPTRSNKCTIPANTAPISLGPFQSM